MLTVNLPACGNTTLYKCEVVEGVIVLVAVTPKGRSIAEIGVGVGCGVGVLKLTLLLLSLLLGLGVGAVDCCVGLDVVGGGAVAVVGGFVCELSLP